ncbi:MAG: alcohol dehydrogenase catalytic domain-containing protein [Sphingobacteriales bacterium]|jgi:D-arabinose 1-dehydrogenase-like Zn-dependent alcohol dehydrogenase|nr:alcohol dehydrogenase catalytic domain-containing protein [Sphingobacteriales bacterium]
MQEISVPEITDYEVFVKVKAAGICLSDAHYRAGISPVSFTPLTFGHKVPGIVEKSGSKVTNVKEGDSVAFHYLITCGRCHHCSSGNEQFCPDGKMIGHHTNGGYAEYIAVHGRNAIILPESIHLNKAQH